MEKDIINVVNSFAMEGTPVECAPYGAGHINKTYLVTNDQGRRYILQRINNHVFKDVDALMENIMAVTEFLQKDAAPGTVLRFTRAKNGASYVEKDGEYWRLMDYIVGVCFQVSEQPEDFYLAARAFGDFQQRLAKFDASILHETIPNFHNTVDRFRQFHKVYEADRMDRNKAALPEIQFALERENLADTLTSQLREGLLPLRVTHNDTKLNNVRFDKETRKPIALLDLDTVMPGLSLYDYGDAVRCGAATADEDEKDLSKMEMSLELFEAFTKGFIEACPDLTQREKEMMPMGIKIIALELGLRFLTDYLDGDHYFAIHREGHNLDRARTQFKLVADVEKKWDQMNAIVAKYM